MRSPEEIITRMELLQSGLLEAVERRKNFDQANAELDLIILSFLDQLETLLWVMDSEPSISRVVH